MTTLKNLISVKIKNQISLRIGGRVIFRTMKYYGMVAYNIFKEQNNIEKIKILPMDKDYALACDEIGSYKVKDYYLEESNNGFLGIVAVDHEGKIIGYVCGSNKFSYAWKYSELKSPSFYIKYVYVVPEHRGKHYARVIVQKLHEFIPNNTLYLMVRENNPRAIKAYEKIGFKKIFLRKFIISPILHKTFFYSYKRFNNI